MGWNEEYTIWEHLIITLYNADMLTKELIEKIVEPFKNTDIDHGGSMDLRAKDGLDADKIVIKLCMPSKYEEIIKFKSEKKREIEFYNAWSNYTRKHWGFF